MHPTPARALFITLAHPARSATDLLIMAVSGSGTARSNPWRAGSTTPKKGRRRLRNNNDIRPGHAKHACIVWHPRCTPAVFLGVCQASNR